MRFTWTVVYILLAVDAGFNAQQNDSERSIPEVEAVDIIKDFSVDTTVGPKNATYCRLEDPTGVVVFDGFSQCRMTVARVTIEHDGIWNMTIGLPGRVLTEDVLFKVNVKEAESDMVVSARVEYQQPSVILTCSVSRAYTVRGCTFRDPWGKVLVAIEGGESEDDTAVRYISNVSNHDCSLVLINPLESLLGVWRCTVETDLGTHYGFLSVTCPWLMVDPKMKDIFYLEPILETMNDPISGIEGTLALTCIIHAPISYCYFKASNGTKFSITPETFSPHLEYIGSGFDAGECGVKFTNIVARDSGQWSCHVGLVNQTVEQSFEFEVTIEEPIIVQHYWHEQYGLVVEARIHYERTLDSCRFVRSDGLAFTTDDVPAGYILISLDEHHCLLQIEEMSGSNLHPWTIIASVKKYGIFTRTITDNVFWFKKTAIPPSAIN